MRGMAFIAAGPEIVVLLAALAVLLVEVFGGRGRRLWAAVALPALGAAIGLSTWQWVRGAEPELFFSGMIAVDRYTAFAGIVVYAVVAFGLLAAWDLIAEQETRGAEMVALILLSATGLHFMAAAANLIMLFVGLEIASISLYVVAGFTRERRAADEAATKYFLLGSFASAVFLYGVALAFAATGSTFIYGPDGIAAFLDGNIVLQPGVLLAGIALILVGLGFKISAAPFHQWAPDVYQGAPTQVVGLMAAGVKVAGFAAMGRILVGAFEVRIGDWGPAVAVLAVLSALIGTALAIAQDDVKRLLAYSGVAHAGFIMTALLGGEAGLPAMWFYVATYAFQLIGAFVVVAVVGGPGPAPFEQYSGLAARSPLLAGSLAVFLLGLGGIPLTAGFAGKFAVFAAAWTAGYEWAVVVALLASVAGLFFYLRIITFMYFQPAAVVEGPGTAVATPEPDPPARIVLGVSLAVTLVLGIVPWPLLEFVRNALPL